MTPTTTVRPDQHPATDLTASADLARDVSNAAACESPGAMHAASHAAVCGLGCGTVVLLCAPHLAEIRQSITAAAAGGNRFGCGVCRSAAAALDDAFTVLPLLP